MELKEAIDLPAEDAVVAEGEGGLKVAQGVGLLEVCLARPSQ